MSKGVFGSQFWKFLSRVLKSITSQHTARQTLLREHAMEQSSTPPRDRWEAQSEQE